MKTRFDDRINGVVLPPDCAAEEPELAVLAPCGDGWKLTRRRLLGVLAAGAVGSLGRAPGATAGCPAGSFAHQVAVNSLSFFPDGNTLISAGQDKLVKFWSIPAAALFRTVATADVPSQVVVSPDGSRLAVAMEGGHLELWSADGRQHTSLAGHTDRVNAVTFSSDGRLLVSVSRDQTTRVWSVAQARLLRTFRDASDTMTRVAVSAAGRPASLSAPLMPLLATAGAQVYLRLFSNGETVQTAPGKAFALSPDGQYLAVHDGARLQIYTFPGLTPLAWVAEKLTATSLAFSADGRRLASAYLDGPPHLYSVPALTSGVVLQTTQAGCLSTAMDPQNRYVAVACGKSILLYHLPAGPPVSLCFMDIASSPPGSSAIQYISGGVLYTIPCGATIPAGLMCSCDCVPGDCGCVNDSGCNCVSDTGCNCDSDSGCSCDSDSGCNCDSDTGCDCVGDAGCTCVADYGCGCVDDYGCGCVGDYGCGCDGDFGCGCDGDSGCGCDGDLGPR